MSQTIPAIFEAGVFRPLQRVDLAEGTQVEVQVHPLSNPAESAGELTPEELAKQRAAIEEMLAEISALPVEGPNDGFSGRDHDKVLYGKP